MQYRPPRPTIPNSHLAASEMVTPGYKEQKGQRYVGKTSSPTNHENKDQGHMIKKSHSSGKSAILALFLCATITGHKLCAATITWTNPLGGNWSNASNWSPNQVPGPGDTAIITNNGIFTVTLDVNANVSALALGGSSGSQTFVISGNTLTLNSSSAFGTNGIFNLSGGALTGTGNLAINGPFNWTGGTISDTGGVTLNGTSTLTGNGTFILSNGSVLANSGNLTWSGGSFGVGTSTITNLPGAIFNITGNGNFVNYGGNNIFGNAGLVQFTGLTGTFNTAPVVLINAGDVQVLSGTINLSSGGTASGSFELATNTTLLFTANYTLNTGSSVTGLGTVNFNGGTINLDGTYNTTGTNLLTGATVNFNIGATVNLDGLTILNGNLAGNLPVAVNGPFNWTGGTIADTGGVTLNGTSTLAGNGTFILNNGSVLANSGNLTWSGGSFGLGTATITNLPSGTFNITGNVNFVNYGGNSQFGNAGLVERTVGTGTVAFSPAYFVNNGNVQVTTGGLNLNNGGTSTGTINVAAPATLYFGGDFTLATSSTVTGPGSVNFNGGTITAGGTYNITGTNLFTGSTVNFSGNYVITNQPVTIVNGAANLGAGGLVNLSALTITGGTLGGSLPVPVNGPFNWAGGTISDGGGVNLNGSSSLSGNGTFILNNSVLVNAGTLTWSGGSFALASGTITNLSSGIFNITGNVGFVNYGGNSLFGNAGLVERTAGTGTVGLTPTYFINNGNVQIMTGGLNLNNGGYSTGTITVAAPATLYFGYDYTLVTGSSVTGPGSVSFNAGTITAGGTYNITGTNLFTGATANFSGNYVITNQPVTIVNGAANLGAGGLVNLSGLTITGGTLGGSLPISINGPFNWTGGTIADTGGVTLNGTSTLSGNGTFILNYALLINAGSLTWSGGSFATVNGTITNLPSGIFNITGNVGFVNYGGNNLFGNAGLVERTVGTGTIALSPDYFINNGGTLDVDTGLVNLNANSSFAETNGALQFGLGGPSQSGQLAVPGNLILGGTLAAHLESSYAPQPGDTISLVTYSSYTGAFTNLNLPVLSSGLGWQVAYTPTAAQVQVISNANTGEQISGSVTDGHGTGVTNITVFASTTNVAGSIYFSTTTDKNGNYSLNVSNGVWSVGLQNLPSRGYNPVTNQVATVNNGNQTVNFVLSPYGGQVYTITTLVSAPDNATSPGALQGAGTYPAGSLVTVVATANTATLPYSFTYWTEGGAFQSANSFYSFTAQRDRQLVAHFTLPIFTITASNNPPFAGVVTGPGTNFYGETNVLTAEPIFGYAFSNWTEGATVLGTSPTLTTVINANHNFVANYSPANLFHVVTTATSPGSVASVTGAGNYTNGQTGGFSAPAIVETPPYLYTFQSFTWSNQVVSTSASFSKTFATTDPTNILYVAVYSTLNIVPQVTNTTVNYPNPVPATTNLVLSFQFDRSMNTNILPSVFLTNAATTLQPAVPPAGYWASTVELNDTYVTPGITLLTGMDGTNQVYISGAQDTNGDNLALTNTIELKVDATAPILSNVAAVPGLTSAAITWSSDKPASSQVEYGLTTAYGSFTPEDGTLVQSHSQTVSGLNANSLYHFRVHSADLAGNPAFSGDYTFTTLAAPDLTVQNLSVTGSLLSGGNLVVGWQDVNSGPGATDTSWYDQVLVTNLTTGQTLLSTLVQYNAAVNGNLGVHGSQSQQLAAQVPNGPAGVGTIEFIVTANVYGNQNEVTLNNNSASSQKTTTLAAYPDLQVVNLGVTNAAIKSGATLDIVWQDTNSGNAAVSGSFQDALTVVNLDTAQTLASVSVPYNFNALGSIPAGKAASQQYSFVLPNGTEGTGHLQITVVTDSGNAIYEYNTAGTGENNNTNSLTVIASLAASPDLLVTNLVIPSSADAGQVIPISWTETNIGTAAITTTWYDQVFITSSDSINGGELLGTFAVSGGLGINQSTNITQNVTLPQFVQGQQWIVVKANVSASFYEPNTVNNTMISTQAVSLSPTLQLTLSASSVAEAAGSAALSGTAVRGGDLSAALTVSLATLTGTNLTVPASVIIPAGQSTASFSVGAVDNLVAGNSVADAVIATASGFATASAPITVLENDTTSLSLTLGAGSVNDDAGTNSVIVTVTRSANLGSALVVNLQSDTPTALTVPGTVTIPAGQASATFGLSPVPTSAIGDSQRVFVLASAAGYSTVSEPIEVLNVNSLPLSLTLASYTVSKGAGNNADVGTVTIPAALASAQNILLTLSNSAIVTIPDSVTIPAGATSANFTISVTNDGLATGTQTATLLAQAVTPDETVLTNGEATTNLVILDVNGPTLSLSLANPTIPKGSNTTVTVTLNTVPISPVTVNLSASPSNPVNLPASVTVPAGKTSATFTVSAVLDNQQTGAESVTLGASATGYNSGVAPLTVSDIYLPDLSVSSINVPGTGLTGSQLTVSWVVLNSGLGAATNVTWNDDVYLSSDPVGQNETIIGSYPNVSGLAIGASYTNQTTFDLPALPGDYWIIITTDSGDLVTELNKNNNTAATAQPIVANPAYRAQLTGAAPAVATRGTPITLTGSTFNPANNSPVPLSAANVHVMVNGTERIFSVTSDVNGNFSYVFQPLANEAGDYTAGADYPAIDTVSNQVSFVLLGMAAYPSGLTAQLLPNTPFTGQLILSNLTDQTLTGLAIAVPNLGGNLAAQFSFTNNTLPGGAAVTVGYQLQSPLTQTAQLKFSLTASSTEGAQLAIPAQITVVPLVAQMQANPAYLAQGMLVGTQTVVSFNIVNTGGASSGDLTVQLPASLPWITLSSAAVIPSIPAGGTATVILTLTPPADLPLTLYEGSLAVANNLTGISMPFQFRAVSSGKGDLRITTTDDYTYYVAGGPKVTNAIVTVRDPITTLVIAQTNSDENGIAYFADLPAGPYTVDASADSHNQFVGSANVVTGTTNDLEAFMARQLVSYDWTVVPSDIPDVYNVQLQSVFETQVPVPNVVIEEPQVMMFVFPGEASQFNLTLRNEGLIAAQGVTVTPPDDPNYIITPLVTSVGTIPAQSEVVVPVTVQLRAAPAIPAIAGGGHGAGPVPQDSGACPVSLSPCLPTIDLNVAWYYPCGGNNVMQQRSAELALLCSAKDTADSIKSCLKKILNLANTPSALSGVNLAKLSCNTISAFLSCIGGNLGPCQKLAISAACGAATGGGLAGAGAAALPGLPACICAHLADIPLPPFPSSGATTTGDGGPDLLLPILPTGSYYVSGNPVVTEVQIGSCSVPGANDVTRVSKSVGSIHPLPIKPPVVSHASAGVCAHVRIEINQQVVLTRTAFTGTLQIDNGDSNPITDVQVTLNFLDSTNGDASADFVTEGPVLGSLTAVDGTGTIAASTTGSAVYTFVPTLNAAAYQPATYQIGGTLSYVDNGQQVTVPLLSSPLTVYPEARLDLIYFQQRDVYGPDPLDPQVSVPSQPFDLGLIVKNVGAGKAHSFQISSGQPQIMDNEKGLLIDFTIIGTEVGDQPESPSLSANLGDIDPGGTKEVDWDLLSTLAGKFISFSATFTHVNDLGATNTSLIDNVEIHSLTHKVLADRPTDDDVPDFLVNDIPNPESLPDTLYLSDGSLAAVNVITNGVFDGPAGSGHLAVQLTTTVSNGWNYIQLPDPGVGYVLDKAVRSDGLVLPMTNDAWTTSLSFPSSSTAPLPQNLVHLFDWAGTGEYTLYYHSTNTVPPAITQLGPVTPFIQPGALSSVDVAFSEPVDPTTFSYTNLSLTLNGGANLLASGNGIGLALVAGTNYVISGLAPYTAAAGNYQLTITGAGIYDLWGNNAGNVSAATTWSEGNAAVVVQNITPVSPNPRNAPVTDVTVTFSKAINAATFTSSALSLTINGGPNLITSGVTITPQSATAFTINGLGQLTGAQGNYALTVNLAAIQDAADQPGFGSASTTWTTITTGPAITLLEPIATNPRNIVVQTLQIGFSEPIDPTTLNYSNITITLNGGPNLVTSDVLVDEVNPTTFVITNFSWVQGYAGTYNLNVNAAGIVDLAGNPGTGTTNESWQIILETPSAPTYLAIAPDTGISSTDGLTDTNSLVLSGTLGASNWIARVFDVTSDTYLGAAIVNGTNFSEALTFNAAGAHQLQVIAVDVAGNVSAPSYFNLFLDTTPPTALIQAVSPNPISEPVTNLLVTFSKAINTNTIHATNFVFTINGVDSATPGISILSSNTVLVTGLAASTGTNATYQLTLQLAGIQDLAGNISLQSVSSSWQFTSAAPPPVFVAETNAIAQPGQLFQRLIHASDSAGGLITFKLDPSAPAGAMISTNGLLSWIPACDQGGTTNVITVIATDNLAPTASSSASFTVAVSDCLQIELGTGVVQVGTTSSIPLTVFSSANVTNLSFSLGYPVNRFTNWTIAPSNTVVGAASAQSLSALKTLFSLTAANIDTLQGSAQLGSLFFEALAAPSAFVPLTITNVVATKSDGSLVTNIATAEGGIVVIGSQPLLEASWATNLQRQLILYGNPGASYQVIYTTNLVATKWVPLWDVPLTNLFESFELSNNFPEVFYRAWLSSSNPPLLDLPAPTQTNSVPIR